MELVELGLNAVAPKLLRQCEHAVTMLAAVVAVADEDAGLSVGSLGAHEFAARRVLATGHSRIHDWVTARHQRAPHLAIGNNSMTRTIVEDPLHSRKPDSAALHPRASAQSPFMDATTPRRFALTRGVLPASRRRLQRPVQGG